MTPAIILPADQWSVLEAGWLWLRGERVLEALDDGVWMLVDDLDLELAREAGLGGPVRERLVPPSIPEGLEPTPCHFGHGPITDPMVTCRFCGGSGVVARSFYVGTEQFRTATGGWGIWQASRPLPVEHERRVALLAEARFTGPPIPVVEGDPRSFDYPCVVLEQWGIVILWDGRSEWSRLPSRESSTSWTQGLQVGDVLVPVAVDMLAEPITDEDAGHRDDHWSDSIGPGRAPLSLVPGTWGTVQ